MSTYLDFEEPLKALEEQIAQTKEIGDSTDVDMADKVHALQQKLAEKTKEIFAGLTPWQRVLILWHILTPFQTILFKSFTAIEM
jgi:acetyl-CoA carboxylase carboxyl transferase subunit alpha